LLKLIFLKNSLL